MFVLLKRKCLQHIQLVQAEYKSPKSEAPRRRALQRIRLTFAECQKLLGKEGPKEFGHIHEDEDMSTRQEDTSQWYHSQRSSHGLCHHRRVLEHQEILTSGKRIHFRGPLASRTRSREIDPSSSGILITAAFPSLGSIPHGSGQQFEKSIRLISLPVYCARCSFVTLKNLENTRATETKSERSSMNIHWTWPSACCSRHLMSGTSSGLIAPPLNFLGVQVPCTIDPLGLGTCHLLVVKLKRSQNNTRLSLVPAHAAVDHEVKC